VKITPKRIFLGATALLVFGLSMIVTVHFTEACRLTTVMLNGEPVENWRGQFTMLHPTSIVSQPVGRLASALLDRNDVFKVDVSYRLPGELDIRTNAFEPACYVVGQESGKLFGLTRYGRLISIDRDRLDWERPVFTGLVTGDLHTFCRDPRVKVTIDQLTVLRDERPDMYRLLDELDFGEPNYLRASISGLPFLLLVRSDRLVDDLDRFIEFAQRFQPDLAGVYRIDLRYDDMVICAQHDEKKR